MESELSNDIIKLDEGMNPTPIVLGRQLYKTPQPPLTAASGATAITADAIITDNTRTRLNELEQRLKNIGIL